MGNSALRQLRQLLEKDPGLGGPPSASGAHNIPASGYKPPPATFDKPGSLPSSKLHNPINPHLTDAKVPEGAWFDSAKGVPESTFFTHFSGAGEPKEYRKDVHKGIREDFLDGAMSVDSKRTPLALVFLGTSGSGKGLLYNNVPEDEFVFASPAVVGTHLPEYSEALQGRGRNAAKLVSEEANWLTKSILKEAMAIRKNVAVDGCGRHTSGYLKLIEQLIAKGYHVRPVLLYTSLDKAVDRVRKRGAQTGRWADETTIQTALKHIPDTFLRLVKKTPAFELYDALTLPPTLAWENSDGEEKAYKEEFIRKFLETHESWESAMKRIFGPKLFAAYEQISSSDSAVQAPTFPDRDEVPAESPGRELAVDPEGLHQKMIQGAKEDYARIRKLAPVFKSDQGVVLPDPEWLGEF
jgi:predicted ABC-type ATPase